jgi:phosphoribosylformylglycinamidine (FGAM) synthase-like enzyme
MQAGLIVSCHDVSEGGLAIALAEMCIAGRLGASISDLPHEDLVTALFSESAGRLVVEVEQRSVPALLRIMDDDVFHLGEVSESGLLSLPGVEPILVADLADAFNSRATAIHAEKEREIQ